MYSGVKEAGRSVRSSSTRRDSNHSRVPGEVSAVIPEEFLAETKRVTRSKIQPINVKIKTFKVPTSNISKDKLKKTLDFKGLCNVDDDDDDNIQESKSKVASNISKKHGRKGNGDTTRKIKKSENRKTKSKTSKCVEHVNDDFITERSDVVVEEGEGRGGSDAEDEIGSSLVPTFREESISDRDPQQQQQQQQHTNVHACYDDDGEDDGDGDDIVVPIAAATINNVDKNINTKVKRSEEALKHLDETLESVVHGSILWYEEHFASDDSADSSISIDDNDDDHHEDNCANDANGNSSELLQKDVSRKEITENIKMYNAENSEDLVQADDKFKKQQKKSSNKRKHFQTGWTSFLEGGSKKLKTKLEKFKDACVSDDDDEGDEGEDAEEQQKSNFQDNESCGHDVMCMNNAEGDEVVETNTVGGNVDMVNEDRSSVITPSLSATTLSVISSSSSSSLASTLSSSVSDLKVTLLEIPNDAKMERESASADVICAKAEDDKLEVSNTESSVKPMDDEAKMSLARRVSQAIMKSSHLTHKNLDNEDLKITKSESQGNSHSKVERSVKSKSDERKSMFMMKLLEENDIKEKIQKQILFPDDLTNAVEANDIAKVKFLLTTLGQFPNKDITGSNLVWSAVKNGYNTMLSVLAMKNANLELKNKDGLTPLLYAAEKVSTLVWMDDEAD
ncbi:hypothetical protein HELRODRAFT_163899 [Helobdella robusta]|uniref:Uncharacterized protein n=1 Tax=Helobdella robusta TaxID=6412 RepID=T1EUL4_HELRO|nr:hypothetical protein HELRODRAFT_163899 [Helobdella robusta]ESN96776.1 hypothetical protein HELRODRAFT_163899 [Helobdella robusta]